MKSLGTSIEGNVKLIAVVGGVLFATLIGALIVVQQSLGSSQTQLAETVVPIQQQLGKIVGAEGSMFLRQSEIVAANDVALKELGNRDFHEAGVRNGMSEFAKLVTTTGLIKEQGFPIDAANSLESDIEVFMQADDELYKAASSYQALRKQIATSLELIEKDLRSLMEASGGLAGVLRLEHVSQLRKLSQKLTNESVSSEQLRPLITGNSRLQLDTIYQLDTAVLRLGVLAGKVGLANSEDALNSLSANELVQNREQIMHVLHQLESQVTDQDLAERVRKLHEKASDLAKRVGDETYPESLASLRRHMLQQEHRVHESQLATASVSEHLESDTAELRSFLQGVAIRAQSSAATTIQRSRQVTLAISVLTLGLAIIAAFRVHSSVLALRVQNNKLSDLSDELSKTNLGLEKMVADRTASLQLVLDSTGDGLLSVDLNGVLLPERSRAVNVWFGESQPGATLWEYLAKDTETQDSLSMAIEQLADDVFPFEVAADQAPKSIERDGKTFALEYREIREESRLVRILVLVRDITAELEAKRAEREMRELHTLVGNLLKDRQGFDQTLEECAALVSEIAQSVSHAVAKRNLHTLKGNCAIVGFQSVADYAHELESMLVDESRQPTKSEITELDRNWQSSLMKIRSYLHSGRETQIEISTSEYAEVKEMLHHRASYEEIEQMFDRWKYEPTLTHLSRLGDQSRQVARRLGKEIEICIHDNQLRVPEEGLRRFWSSMIHIIRNAVDHGIETPEQRQRLGKPPVAKLELMTRQVDGYIEIGVSDDGRGIDWQQVRKIAKERGLPHATAPELTEVLFCDGVSTREVATDISGRGVGLSAVRSECEKAGGTVVLESQPGIGTRFIFRFPIRELCWA